MVEYHMGRSFDGTLLEDDCPCPKAPCGLVVTPGLAGDDDCPQHSMRSAKTIRQYHRADECPNVKEQG